MTLRLGFLPLTDAAPLCVAETLGFFRKRGLEVDLSREASWANIRDKVAFGALEGGHMLAALPLASTLGLGGIHHPMLTALTLGLNGNAVTFSTELWSNVIEAEPSAADEHRSIGIGLKRVVERRRSAGQPALTFAVVFPYASHNYLLRGWLEAAGIDPDRDLRIVVVPPPLMVSHLMARRIDGCCVGEPWGARAVELGVGRIAIASYHIWNNHPEKVLGVSGIWAEREPATHAELIAAVIEAQRWLDESANRREAAQILASERYIGLPESVIALSLEGRMPRALDEPPEALDDFHVFHRYAAGFPWVSHAIWTLAQMRRWGQIDADVDLARTARAVHRPDLYRWVASSLGLAAPATDMKREGEHQTGWRLDTPEGGIAMGPDGFIGGGVFDPDEPDAEGAPAEAVHARVPRRARG